MTSSRFSLHSSLIESIESRKTLFLDTSAWIHLADGKTLQCREIRDKLVSAVNREKLICPVVASNIWEVRKQRNPTFTKTIHLMENLSNNVSMRGPDKVVSYEIDHLIEYLISGIYRPLSKSEIYGSILSYLGETAEKRFDPHLDQISLSSLVDALGEASFPSISTKYERQKTIKERTSTCKGSIQNGRRVEKEFIAEKFLIPLLLEKNKALPFDQRLKLIKSLIASPKDRKYASRIDHLLHFLPFLSAYTEVMTVSGLDTNRKDCMNDFFDLDFLICAIAYSGTFCAIDGWITDLVGLIRRNKVFYHIDFKANLSSLEEYANSFG